MGLSLSKRQTPVPGRGTPQAAPNQPVFSLGALWSIFFAVGPRDCGELLPNLTKYSAKFSLLISFELMVLFNYKRL